MVNKVLEAFFAPSLADVQGAPSLASFFTSEWRDRRDGSRERIGWYLYDWANSSIPQAALPVLFLFFLSGLADLHARAGGSALEECAALGGSCVTDRVSVLAGKATCTAEDGSPLAVSCGVCVEGRGDMVWAAATRQFQTFSPPTVRFIFDVTSTTFAGTVVAIASFIQLFVFITCGAWADIGRLRRRGLFASTLCGCVSVILMITVTRPALYWLAGVFVIVAIVGHGLANVYYNAYLPILVDAHPAVAAAEARARRDPTALKTAIMTRELHEALMSSLGFMVGYIGGLICFSIAGVLLVLSSRGVLGSLLAMRIGLVVVGVWWGGFSLITWRNLSEHPGQPMPPFREFITLGWRSTASLVSRVRQLPHMARFMIAWFFLSDTFFTINGVGVLFAARELCLSFADVAIIAIMVFLQSILGNMLWLEAQRRLELSSKGIVLCCSGVYVLLSFWALIGAVEASPIGLKSRNELFIYATVHGLTNGAVQAYSRALFSELVETGKEGEYFAIYQITDKGSSFLGAFIFPLVGQVTGERRLGFGYLLGMAIVAMASIASVNAHEGARQAKQRSPSTEEMAEGTVMVAYA